MSFVDLATLALHRRNEMEIRIRTFAAKCDNAINDIRKLKTKSRTFVEHLNCEPAELKDRFLACMKQLDEYIYLMTDFNLAISKLDRLMWNAYMTAEETAPEVATCRAPYVKLQEVISNIKENGSMEMAPVQDTSYVAYPILTPTNLMDVLSEPTPSTSIACQNMCPVERPRRKRIPKEEQLLIAFSSNSCSSESFPEGRNTVASVQSAANKIEDLTVKDPEDVVALPAQTVLQVDHVYPAIIMATEGHSLWVLTGDISHVFDLMGDMKAHYKNHQVTMTLEEIANLTCCVFYENDTDSYYRALFVGFSEEDTSQVEVFLVDTGDFRAGGAHCVQPIEPRFCQDPPFARCCYLADVELLCLQNEELVEKHEEFMKQFVGKLYSIRVDDNTSESLGVYVLLDATTTLNERLVKEGLATAIDKSPPQPQPLEGDLDLDISQCSEHEDPVLAVTGYSNRDEIDICKHYKGGPDKTCFKGARCTKRHVLKHPDGWTLDRVAVPACRSLPLPAPGSWHRVLVTYVCHFDRVCVQFVTDEIKEEVPIFGVVLPPMTLEGLVRDMNSPGTRMAYKKMELAPAPGELVAALYPPDDQWYRARVAASTRADQSVEVIYIDYGNEVWVKEDAIRVLEPRFLSLPAQALRCRLAGVAPRSANSKQWAAAKSALAEMTQDRKMDARVIARDFDELTIELIDGKGYSVAEQLEALGLTAFEEFDVEDDTNVKFKMIPV